MKAILVIMYFGYWGSFDVDVIPVDTYENCMAMKAATLKTLNDHHASYDTLLKAKAGTRPLLSITCEVVD